VYHHALLPKLVKKCLCTLRPLFAQCLLMDVAALLYILGSFVPEIPSFCAPSAYYCEECTKSPHRSALSVQTLHLGKLA
jgi:hypothetical protein